MAYTIYLSQLTTLSSSSHFQSSHVYSIFSGSGALFSLFSPLFPLLLLLLYFLCHTGSASCLHLVLFFLCFFSFLFHLLHRRSIGSDFSFYFLRGKEAQNACQPNLCFWPEFTEMPETHRNRPKFSPRWSKRVSHSGL